MAQETESDEINGAKIRIDASEMYSKQCSRFVGV